MTVKRGFATGFCIRLQVMLIMSFNYLNSFSSQKGSVWQSGVLRCKCLMAIFNMESKVSRSGNNQRN